MQINAKKMPLCKKYAKYIHKICTNTQKYAKAIAEICQKICRKYTEYAYIFFHINALPLPALLIMMSASALAMVQEMIFSASFSRILAILRRNRLQSSPTTRRASPQCSEGRRQRGRAQRPAPYGPQATPALGRESERQRPAPQALHSPSCRGGSRARLGGKEKRRRYGHGHGRSGQNPH